MYTVPDALTIMVTSPEKSVNYRWEKESGKLSRDLQILSIDDLNSLPLDIRQKNFDVKHFSEGMVLVKDPINNRYIRAEEANEKLPKLKNDAIDHIVSLLGAKRIRRSVIQYDEEKQELDASGNIKVFKMSASANYSSVEIEAKKKEFTREKRFSGNRSVEGYNQALEYCEKNGLIYDPEIRQILEDRAPSHPNPVTSDSYKITLTSESAKAMEAAFSLSYLGCFSLSAAVKESISIKRMVIIEFEVEYGES